MMGPVMLIEDDVDARESMRTLLSGAGYRVIASDEGRKALELASITRPSVVVLDLVTPGMNGWDFLARRAEEPALSMVPVVVVTGSETDLPRGAAALLQKPVDPAELLRTLHDVLQDSAARRNGK
jgi:CheY-like chemotaxis protein